MVSKTSFRHKDWTIDTVVGLAMCEVSCECGDLFISGEPCYREKLNLKEGSKGPFNWPSGDNPRVRYICHKCAIKLGLIW